MNLDDHRPTVEQLAELLLGRKQTLVTAESCTGGLLAGVLTDLAGSSSWFYGGFVTYTLEAKRRCLGVEAQTLDRWGAVSEPTAQAMAAGALAHSSADLSVSVTGVAGPGGGEPLLPVGTVWFGWAERGRTLIHTAEHQFEGDRASVRDQAVDRALQGLLRLLETPVS
ncbi:MAG: CinA family protein [Pseudomonadota bacterium]